MASPNLAGGPASAATLKGLLDSPEIGRLIETLEATRWTGRPGWPIRTMIGLALAKSLYALPTWTKVVALVADHWKLQRVLGCEGNPPSQWAAYRFATKLRENDDAVQRCIDGVVEGLKAKLPTYGRNLAIDASDMPAYANGQRYVWKGGPERNWHTDPDASWGHRSAIATRKGGGFYGFKLQAAVCTATDLPVAWSVETAKDNESMFVAPLLDAAKRRGAMATTCAMDKAYDITRVYAECAERDCEAIVPLRATGAVVKNEDRPPGCHHGVWVFGGADRKRGATKWRCPSGECKPASTWIKADRLHPLMPRESKRWKDAYRKRSAVEREFGRLKHQWGLKPLRVRGLERVRLHADLTILTKLACALAKVRAASATRTRQRSGGSRKPTRGASKPVRPEVRRN
ncbi:MAG TPA: transposase [Chloroflexota bacterium]|nr:transposase [Chloroflexota bacterium]